MTSSMVSLVSAQVSTVASVVRLLQKLVSQVIGCGRHDHTRFRMPHGFQIQ